MIMIGGDASAQDRLLLENLRILDVERGEMSGPQDLLVKGDRIEGFGEFDGPALRIDCTGKYAVPGLCDCHTHVAWIMKKEDPGEQLRAFVKGGVLYVRDVGGPVDVLSGMKRRIAAGELVGPEIFFCGPMLEKSPLTWEAHNQKMPGFTVAVNTNEDVDRLLPELAAEGACMIKTFSKQNPDVYEHMVEKAKELSLRIVHDPGGPLFHHMPMDRALALGVTSIEHGKAPWPVVLKDELKEEHDALLARFAGRSETMPLAMKIFEMQQDSVSLKKIDKLCATMREKEAYLCPTLQVFAVMKEQGPPEGVPEQAKEMMKKVFAAMEKMSAFFTAEFHRRGVKLLAGQDGIAPDGVLSEMELMKACGVPEAEILRGATLHPARWLGVEDRIGSIGTGKEANLLVLDGNPLDDIKKIRSAFLVVQKGDVVFRKDTD
jgi:imidazolonepropionase-like amidohydrolase